MADNPGNMMQETLCWAYRELVHDKIGTQANRITDLDAKASKGLSDVEWRLSARITAIETRLDKIETRLLAFDKYQSEQVGLTKGQATLWGLGLIVVSAIVSTLIKLYLEGVVA